MNLQDTEALLQSSRHVPQSGLSFYLADLLKRLNSSETLLFIAHLCEGTVQRLELFERVLLAFLRQEDFADLIGYERVSAIYQLAAEKNNIYLQALIRRSELKEKQPLLSSEEEPRLVQQLELLTLGERREFAKGIDPQKLQMLLYDTDVIVVANLLQNRRVFEESVLKISTRRPQSAAVLKQVFCSDRWISRYPVKKALAFNPYTPKHIALGLVNFLKPAEWKFALANYRESLANEFIERAEQLLKKSR